MYEILETDSGHIASLKDTFPDPKHRHIHLLVREKGRRLLNIIVIPDQGRVDHVEICY